MENELAPGLLLLPHVSTRVELQKIQKISVDVQTHETNGSKRNPAIEHKMKNPKNDSQIDPLAVTYFFCSRKKQMDKQSEFWESGPLLSPVFYVGAMSYIPGLSVSILKNHLRLPAACSLSLNRSFRARRNSIKPSTKKPFGSE